MSALVGYDSCEESPSSAEEQEELKVRKEQKEVKEPKVPDQTVISGKDQQSASSESDLTERELILQLSAPEDDVFVPQYTNGNPENISRLEPGKLQQFLQLKMQGKHYHETLVSSGALQDAEVVSGLRQKYGLDYCAFDCYGTNIDALDAADLPREGFMREIRKY